MNQTKIYVGNLCYNSTDSELQEHFSIYGDIDELKLIKDHMTGQSKGFAFITYKKQQSAQESLKSNKALLNGRAMKVNMAVENKAGRGPSNQSFRQFR